MATPFDDMTWRLRFESGVAPISPYEVELSALTQAVMSLASSGFQPLKQQTTFCVNVASDHTASVAFNEDTPENIRNVWSHAQDVYYDPEFYTVRGDLHFDANTGSTDAALSNHFVVTYRGKLGPGGTQRELFVALLDEHSAFEPTADLVRRRLGLPRFYLKHRGSWKADG